MTHASVPEETRKELGISDTLVRLSVGLESPEDLVADINQALDLVVLFYKKFKSVFLSYLFYFRLL